MDRRDETFRFDFSELEEFTEALAQAPKELEREVARGYKAAAINLQGRIEGRIRGGWSPNANPDRDHLLVRSGSLRGSFGVSQERGTEIEDIDTIVFSESPYALIHELGGTIRPTRKKALTVPLPAAMDPSGIVRLTAAEWMTTGETFLFDRPGEPPLVAREEGGALEFLFVLVPEVTIPPRLGAGDELESADFQRFLAKEMADRVLKVLRAA